MNITDIRIKKINGFKNLKAFASITIDDAIAVHDLKIVEGKNGLFVSMPSKKVGDRYLDVSHPVTAESRSKLMATILTEYQALE